MRIVAFAVYGLAVAKGSTRAFLPKGAKFPVVTSTARNLKEWENLVRFAAQEHCGRDWSLDGPKLLTLHFSLPRPKSLAKKKAPHLKKPDLDKLVRAVNDALTGILYHDDAQIVSILASKEYAHVDETPRVHITVKDDDYYAPSVQARRAPGLLETGDSASTGEGV